MEKGRVDRSHLLYIITVIVDIDRIESYALGVVVRIWLRNKSCDDKFIEYLINKARIGSLSSVKGV